MDPITVLATATAAFNFVKKGISAGKELEGMVKQLGGWYQAVTDFRIIEEKAKNPPLFRKLLFSGSVEQEALQLLIHRKQIAQQEKELRELIVYTYGLDEYREMLQIRREIAGSRENLVKRRKLKLQELRTLAIQLVALGVLLSALGWLVVLFLSNI
jgi:hypothetical protein